MVSWDSSIPLGKISGIPIRLHVLFPVVLIFTVLDQLRSSWQYIVWASLLYGPILLLSVLVHELGHCVAARAVGSRPHSILLWPLGGLAFIGHSNGPKEDLVVAVSGPATHLVQGAVWVAALVPAVRVAYGTFDPLPWVMHVPAPESHLLVAVLAGAVQLNVVLLVFNLCLPAYPLDGGRILADLLLIAGLQERAAATALLLAGGAVGGCILVWGLATWRVLVMLIGAWVLVACVELFSSLQSGRIEEHPLFLFDVEPQTPLYFYSELNDNEAPQQMQQQAQQQRR